MFAMAGASVTRRAFIGRIAVNGAAAGTAWMIPGAVWCGRSLAMDWGHPQPVVSFYMDQLYLDISGTALPYLPPDGARSGEPAAYLDEQTFRGLPI